MTFNWQFLDENLCFVTVPGHVVSPPCFPAPADAETGIGEDWGALADAGVASVDLVNGGAIVYGPMSLHPTNPA